MLLCAVMNWRPGALVSRLVCCVNKQDANERRARYSSFQVAAVGCETPAWSVRDIWFLT